MEFGYVVVLIACLLGAACMYVAVEYHLHGERQQSLSKLLKAQADTAAVKKELAGFSKYTEYLAPAKTEISDKLKLLLIKVVREYTHTEMIPREQFKLKTPVLMVVHYSVEYAFNMDLKPESFELKAAHGGIELNLRKPMLMGYPNIKVLSHETGIEESQIDQKSVVNEIQIKLPAQVRKYGTALATEDATLALCEQKLLECLRNFLSAQKDIKQVPIVTVSFK